MTTLNSSDSSNENVSFLGPEGTFTHEAALQHFGKNHPFRPAPSIPGVFDAVKEGDCEWGVVPIENSIGGGVTFTLDKLLVAGLSIQAEIFLNIEQCLITAASSLREVERVHSHPQGLAQCRDWLHKHVPHAEAIADLSTTGAVYRIQSDPKAAAIAGRLAAELTHTPIFEAGIQDRSTNVTRFVVLGRGSPAPTGRDKTSLAFSTRNERGALFRALQVFDEAHINLTRIESRPSGGTTWECVFHVDLEGHQREGHIMKALSQLQNHSDKIQLLGSYPRL